MAGTGFSNAPWPWGKQDKDGHPFCGWSTLKGNPSHQKGKNGRPGCNWGLPCRPPSAHWKAILQGPERPKSRGWNLQSGTHPDSRTQLGLRKKSLCSQGSAPLLLEEISPPGLNHHYPRLQKGKERSGRGKKLVGPMTRPKKGANVANTKFQRGEAKAKQILAQKAPPLAGGPGQVSSFFLRSAPSS